MSETVFGKAFFHFGGSALEFGFDPAIGQREVHVAAGKSAIRAFRVHQDETGGVPEFVAEIAVTFATVQIEIDVSAQRSIAGHGEAEGVGTEGRNAFPEFLAGRLGDGVGLFRIHQSERALFDERIHVDAVDQVDRVQGVAFGFGHFLAVGIADQTHAHRRF